MFTGLIREIATVKSYKNNVLTIQSKHKAKVGDSIAVNGVCLTVIKVNSDGFDLEVADETRSIVPAEKFQGKVHIEPAMQMNDRFEGHIVQGHVDCIGEVTQITKRENGTDFIIKVDPKYITYIIPKGSITIDGISLTVNDVYDDCFRITIIPHTLENTLIRNYKVGTKVNIETDVFARYIDHILAHRSSKNSMGWDDIDKIQMSY
ncbi:riboflavin synthase subunit alpha [Sulfurovum lithotrophicum]|uniref:Riboflavin synthase n=1 Tax=Sulfurovum lithotrophicum TaxID=206403 RepID=A0A7U4M2J1_9BACT|nr:riboflavin synthase [Sulfurovum lithotrophicum]AKF25682.1 riboflavin synthase subunit alpha [Sulfurovum lithotrophicum]